MNKYYTDEKNVQIVIALLKLHGIKRAVLSPGSANSPLVASIQRDSFFEAYSCVDERSAAYMACGMADESGEPVILSCTGATASRNYLPGITEAHYRNLPILAITSTQPIYRVGHHIAQVVDRSVQPRDTYTHSATLPIIKDDKDRIECEVKINNAILELSRGNGGPVHLNLQTEGLNSYNCKDLPKVRRILRYSSDVPLPPLPPGKVAIILGSHRPWSASIVEAVEQFCELYDVPVFCDHTSNYQGAHKVLSPIIGGQQTLDWARVTPDLTIHLGEVSGDYYSMRLVGKEVWRVNPDGELRDTFGKLTAIFSMPEGDFFRSYLSNSPRSGIYFPLIQRISCELAAKTPELPFSNIWIASEASKMLPQNSTLHLGILNSLRSWNLFPLDQSIRVASNVGGFGIDGCLSSAIGAALVDPGRLYFCVLGDLAFFYDINSLGNRHLPHNLRILLINNGMGTEFKTYKHHTSHFGDQADEFISAAGHFGNKSPELVKHYAQDLGFEYFSAHDKAGAGKEFDRFLNPKLTAQPMVFEVFTDSDRESKALERMLTMMDAPATARGSIAKLAKSVLGTDGAKAVKKILGR